MNNTFKTALFAGASLLVSASYTLAPVNPGFEGEIIYKINVDGGNDQMAQMMQNYSIKTYIKGDKSRTESNMGMMNSITITDNKNPKQPVVLINMMGSKYQIKIDPADLKNEEANQPVIKYLGGSKTIAGYACKEAQITMNDAKTGNKTTSEVYYTGDLPYNTDSYESHFKGLKGFPLSYSMSQNGMNFTVQAESVKKESVPDSLFATPSGYKLVTKDEMQKDLMQKMGGGGN
jgi:GLPGLI family protein